MNRDQLDLIPDNFLKPSRAGCKRLIEWLHARGWQMTLTEVDAERRARGIVTNPTTKENS